MLLNNQHRAGAVAHAKTSEDLFEVPPYRVRANLQLVGDVLIALALLQELGYSQLAWRQVQRLRKLQHQSYADRHTGEAGIGHAHGARCRREELCLGAWRACNNVCVAGVADYHVEAQTVQQRGQLAYEGRGS